jgi:hypothetical protein
VYASCRGRKLPGKRSGRPAPYTTPRNVRALAARPFMLLSAAVLTQPAVRGEQVQEVSPDDMSDAEGGDAAGADAEAGDGGGEVRADQLGVSYDGERTWGDDREDVSEAPSGRGRTFGDESDEDDASAAVEGHGLEDPLGGGDAGKALILCCAARLCSE